MTILCKLRGGFGNHLSIFMLACILNNKLNSLILLEINNIINDELKMRNDTRTTLPKLINKNYITEKPEINKKNVVVKNEKKYKHILENSSKYIDKNIIINIIHCNKVLPNLFEQEFNNITKYFDIPILNYLNYTNTLVISFRLGMGKNEVAPNIFSKNGRGRIESQIYINDINKNITKNDIDHIIICSDNYTDTFINEVMSKITNTNNINCIYLKNHNTIEHFYVILHSKYFVYNPYSSFAYLGNLFRKLYS